MIDKILAYETGGHRPDAPAVFVADDADDAGNFQADADELAQLATSIPTVKIYLGDLGITASRDAIVRAFDDGASIVNYIGHGGINIWAEENVFNTTAVGSLSTPSELPIVLTMNCLNGYYHFPYFDSLSEALMKADGRGAIATFSPSGLSLNGPAHRYHRELLEAGLGGGPERLGDAIVDAQARYAESGALPELLSIYHLFGDPALVLR